MTTTPAARRSRAVPTAELPDRLVEGELLLTEDVGPYRLHVDLTEPRNARAWEKWRYWNAAYMAAVRRGELE